MTCPKCGKKMTKAPNTEGLYVCKDCGKMTSVITMEISKDRIETILDKGKRK